MCWLFIKAVKKQHNQTVYQNNIQEQSILTANENDLALLAVQNVNKNLPLHNMWDGFWIHELYQQELTISCSFDSIYYRNFDIIFSGVTFFNVPIKWRDTDMQGDDFLRLANKDEFMVQQPNFDTSGLNIFALDIYFNFEKAPDPHTFFIIAKSVKLVNCTGGEASPRAMYDDPYPTDMIYSKRNKMQ